MNHSLAAFKSQFQSYRAFYILYPAPSSYIRHQPCPIAYWTSYHLNAPAGWEEVWSLQHF